MRHDTGTPSERDWEPGIAGASARAEYERRQARDDARRRARFGPLAPVVRVLAGPRATTAAFGSGAVGEERVGPILDRAVGNRGIVLHDRRWPGTRRSNIDHIVIASSGVWVIDTKQYHGLLRRQRVGGCWGSREILMVGRRDETRRIASSNAQRMVVEKAVGADIRVRAALCFTGVDRPPFARPFVMDGVLVTWPRALVRTLRRSGSLKTERRAEVATLLSHGFPPYER